MTTRLREIASQAGDIQGLEPLPEALGLQMLVTYMRTSIEALQEEGQLVGAAQLVKKCNGLPIMLRSLAVMCRGRGVDFVLAYLEDHRLELEVPQVDAVGDYDYTNLFVALEYSLKLLQEKDPDTVKRLEMLSIFPEDEEIPQMVANRLWGVSAAIGAQTIRTLADSYLVDHRAGRISLLDLHRDYLRCRSKYSLALWHSCMLQRSGVQEIGPDAEEEWASEQFLFYHARGAMAGGKAHNSHNSPLLPELRSFEMGQPMKEDIAVIAALLRNGELPRLATIGMRDCGIGDQGFLQLAAAFPTDTVLSNLQKLDLTSNELTDASLSALGDVLTGCAHLLNGLSELSLTDNQIRDQGLAALVAPCKGGRALGALSVLHLGTNLIGSAGLASLSAALAESAFPNLTELFLYENKIDSLAALLGAVRRSGCVLRNCTILDLSSNKLADESLGAEFTDTLREGAFASLRTFRVGYNETTETCKQALKKACEARSIRLEGVTPHSHSFESAMTSSFGA